jgi:hypothetical protein
MDTNLNIYFLEQVQWGFFKRNGQKSGKSNCSTIGVRQAGMHKRGQATFVKKFVLTQRLQSTSQRPQWPQPQHL